MRRAIPLLLAGLLLGAADAPPAGSPPPASASPPAAETGPSLPGVTPDKLAAAHELLAAMNTKSNAIDMIHNLRDVLVHNIEGRNSNSSQNVGEIVDDVLMPEITSRIDEFELALAEVQASAYTLDELHEMTAFYRTPLGQRMVALAPKVGAMSFVAGQEWGKRVATDALQKHAQDLRERGVKL